MKFSLENFLKTCRTINYKKNEHVLRQGKVSKNAYFVIEGVIKHYAIDYLGIEKTIRISKENNFFYI